MFYDVWTLYFETDAGDGFPRAWVLQERGLESQVTIGLLTDAAGFSLMVSVFEGNKAEATTILPVIDRSSSNPGRGAIGHRLGASGARLMTALVHRMTTEGVRYGLQTRCEGGLANATIIEPAARRRRIRAAASSATRSA